MNDEPQATEAGLPSGTVTFLFTDIEGSTRLERELRERYSEVLAEHQLLLRRAFERYGGREIVPRHAAMRLRPQLGAFLRPRTRPAGSAVADPARDGPSGGRADVARIDRRLVDRAPWVPLFTPRTPYLVSRRVGNWQYHPYNAVLLDQLWVR